MSSAQTHGIRPADVTKSAVLCIEDDPIVQLMLDDIVGGAGAECIIAGTAQEAEAHLADARYDLVLLDRRLPDSDGLLLLQTIKQSSDCPVVILSAMVETRDKLLGIGLGAAEYVTKPFNPLELSSRIRQLLGARAAANAGRNDTQFDVPGFGFNARTRRLDVASKAVFLAPAEARLLHTLLLAQGEVQTRDELSRFVCGRDWSPGDRTIDVLINRLRGRIRSSPAQIVTIHRTGYLLLFDETPDG